MLITKYEQLEKNCSDRGVLMARKNLLKGFKKPKGITFEHLETNPNYGKFTAYPFETGFGTTVGNTLRRVLLFLMQQKEQLF